MKFKTNRFSIFPHQCSDCKQYIWMETYRRGEVWEYDRWIKKEFMQRLSRKIFTKDRSKEYVIIPRQRGKHTYERYIFKHLRDPWSRLLTYSDGDMESRIDICGSGDYLLDVHR